MILQSMNSFSCTLFAALILAAAARVGAQCQNLEQTFYGPFAAASDDFGSAVAVSENYIVVGSRSEDTSASNVGRAYLYSVLTGELSQTFNNPAPDMNDNFGVSVAVAGDYVLVGAYLDDTGGTDAGSAYLYSAATGALIRAINHPGAGDRFGWSVAASGDYLLIGAYGADIGATDAGAAYLISASTGVLLQTFSQPAPGTNDQFGWSVAVSGDYVVVGAHLEDTGAGFAGSAYLFSAASGAHLRTFNNPTPALLDEFGYTVAVSGDNVVVGCWADDTGGGDSGSAYQFSASTGALIRTIDNPTPSATDNFGWSVSISGDNIVVGARLNDVGGGTRAGSAHLFDAVTGALLMTIHNPDPVANDNFGRAVAVSGSSIVVGAPEDDFAASNAGSAYLFDCPPPPSCLPSLSQTLDNPTPASADEFGGAVAASSDYVVVGAENDDTGSGNAGSAYVFDAATGTLLQTLNNPTPAAGDRFGRAVAVWGETVLVGAPWDDTGATDAGSVYLFDAATGALLRTINSPAAATSEFFGISVAIYGDLVVVGATGNNTGASQSGIAYLFSASTGTLLQTFNNPTPEPFDWFGWAVAIWENTVVVGARFDDTGASDAGSAYVFNTASGGLIHTLSNPEPGTGDDFGWSVSIWGDSIVVGAHRDDTPGTWTGSAHLFSTTTGALVRTFNHPDLEPGDRFGSGVSIWGDTVVVGANGDDANPGASESGIVYLFEASTGMPIEVFNNPNPENGAEFGFVVAIWENTVVTGAHWDNTGATDSGSAYLYNCAPTATPTPSPDPTATPTPSPDPSATPSPDATATLTATPTPSPDASVTPSATPTPSPDPTATASPDPSATPTATSTPLPTPVPCAPALAAYTSLNTAISGIRADADFGFAAAGRFDLAAPALICELSVFGLDLRAADTIENLSCRLMIHADAGSVPGAVIADLGFHTPFAVTDTGTDETFLTAGNDIHRIDFRPTAFVLPAGTWWLSIYDETAGNTNLRIMRTTDTGAHSSQSPAVPPDTWQSLTRRLALVVSGEPAPTPTPTLPATPTPSPDPTATPTPVPCCPGDANNSGSFVDANDFIAVQANFGADNGVGGLGDANCSGSFVDANDFIAVQANFGADCG